MPYPERAPIYEAYKSIVKKIVDQKLYREYAESEIKALNRELMSQLEMIGMQIINTKFNSPKHKTP